MANTSWHDVTGDGPEALQRSLILRESDTNNQRSYSTKLLPELLQTHDYARAFFDGCSAVMGMADDSEALALARLQRQTALDLPGYDFHMLIDEAALRVTVGSSEVMTTQIRHLMNILTARAHVRIGIIALNAEFLAPADSFDFSYATDSEQQADHRSVRGRRHRRAGRANLRPARHHGRLRRGSPRHPRPRAG